MKHLLTAFFFSIFSLLTIAQDLRIVKDNINCTYGIKDEEGNWVVDATYILIEEYNSGHFLMRNEMGLGIFTPNGKEMVPCKYDQIIPLKGEWHIKHEHYDRPIEVGVSKTTFFQGVRDKRSYFINSRGVELAAFGESVKFEFDLDSSVIVYDLKNKSSSYMDTAGTLFFENLSGYVIPFQTKEFTLIGESSYHYDRYYRSNARLIDRYGKLLMKDTFDIARIDSEDRVCYRLNKLYGVTSIKGDTILSPKYIRADGSLSIDQQYWTISDQEGHIGILRNDGEVMIEPTYERMDPLDKKHTLEWWYVTSQDRKGVIGINGDTIIPIEFDQLIRSYTFQKDGISFESFVGWIGEKKRHIIVSDTVVSMKEYDEMITVKNHFIIRKKGKLGVLSKDGALAHPIEFDAYFRPSYYNYLYLFSKGDELTQMDFSKEELSSQKFTLLLSDQSVHIYVDSTSSRTIALEMSKDGQSVLDVRQDLNIEKFEHLLVLASQNWEEATLFNLETKRKSPLTNLKSVYSIDRELFWIETKSRHKGVINSRGKVVIDTIYFQLKTNDNSDYFWGQKSINGMSKWVLLDNVGRQVIPNQFDASFEINKGDQIASQNQKKGLIDSETLRWKIRPEYLCLIRSFGDYYYVGNDLNKKGIIRSDGEVILPVEYDSIVALYSNCQLNGQCPVDRPIEIKWLITKGKVEYLADQEGKLINSRSGIRNFKANLLFDDDTTQTKTPYYFQLFPTLDYSPSLHFLRGLTEKQIQLKRAKLWKSSILKDAVLDTINAIWEKSRVGCNQTYYSWGVIVEGNQPKPNLLREKARRSCDCVQTNRYNYSRSSVFQLRSIGSKFVTIDISYQNQNWGWDHFRSQAPPAIPNNQHINIIEENGKSRYLTLKDIFPDDDILMQEFMEALKLRDDLKLDCSSLESMLEMVNGSFSLSDEGVILYLNQSQYYDYTYKPVELVIPIERLEKLAASKWIVPFLQI